MSGIQHIAEVGFDISAIYKQFQEIEKAIIEEGVKLSDLAKKNWSLDGSLAQGGNLAAISDNLKKSVSNADALNTRIASLSATEKDLLSVYSKSQSLQAQIAKLTGGNTRLYSQQSSEIRSGVAEIWKSYQQTKSLNDEERERLSLLTQQLQLLKSEASMPRQDVVSQRSPASSGFSPMELIGSYQLFQLGKRSAQEMIDTITDVETRMMEISRVMGLTKEQSDEVRSGLFGMAQEMGREFEATSEIMLRFTQAGYNPAESIEMTRTALLAMNTAELDAENSTNSMIGILKQWKYESKDLITVIDRLNYTADTNAITTQDLVDGLLRSSSAAKNAKFSFEETVGALVALKEASGRSGREIGTALNSMISYTTRDKSLDVFEGLGVKVWLDEQKTELNSVMNIWQQLSELYRSGGESVINVLSKQTDMTELYSEEIAAAAGATDEYNKYLETQTKLQGELNDAERKTLTEQFGVYRRNYMIALLENYEQINEVVDKMGNAEGHSLRENERYMATLEAKVTQLVTSLKELAVQAGEAGLLDLAKMAISTLTAVANLTKGVGGLVPVMITLAGVMAMIKRESINTQIAAWGNTVIDKMKGVSSAAQESGGYTKLFFKTLRDGAPDAAAAAFSIGGFVTAIGIATMAISAWNQSQEAARQKRIQMAQENAAEVQSLKSLKDEYLSIVDSTDSQAEKVDQLTNFKKKLAEQYGVEASMLADLNLQRESGINLLDEEIKKSAEATLGSLGRDFQSAKTYMEQPSTITAGGDYGSARLSFDDSQLEALKEAGAELENIGRASSYIVTISGKGLEDYKGNLEKVISLLNTRVAQGQELTVSEQNLLEVLDREHSRVQGIVDKYGEIYSVGINATAQVELSNHLNALSVATVTSQETFETWVNTLLDRAGDSEPLRQSLENMAYELFPQYNEALQVSTELSGASADALNSLGTAAISTVGNIADLQTEISSLESTMQSLVDGKGLSLDATLDLINKYPELASAIRFVGDEWYFEANALESLRQAKYADLAATEAQNIATMLASSGNAQLVTSANELATRLLAASTAAERMAVMSDFVALASNRGAAGIDGMAAASAKLQAIIASSQKSIVAPGVSYQGSADAIKRDTEARNQQIKSIQKQQSVEQKAISASVKALQNALKEKQKVYDAEKKEIQSRFSAFEKAIKAEINQAKRRQKEEEKAYKAQQKAVESRYDTELDYLKRLKAESSQSDSQADYENKREELLAERSDMEKRTSREAVERILEIDKQLSELDESERRRLRDLEIDNKVAAIEEAKAAELSAIEETWERRKEAFDLQIEAQQALLDSEKERVAAVLEAKQVEIDAEKERVSLEIEGIQAAWDLQKETYAAQIEALRETASASINAAAAVNQSYTETANNIQFNWLAMFQRAKEASKEWLRSVISDGLNVSNVISSVMNRLQFLKSQNQTNGNPSTGGKQVYEDFRNQTYPKSHTGSLVTGEGAVHVAPGEIIVRDDISAGLISIIKYMQSGGSGNKAQIIGPLFTVTQTNSSQVDADINNRKLSELVKRMLDNYVLD